ERIGGFDPALDLYGDEEDWQARLLAAGGRIRYVATAGLDHRRAAPDATLFALARAARDRGRNSRRFDARRGEPPTVPSELRVLVAGGDRPELDGLMNAARAELAGSRHDVTFAVGAGDPGRGKFENLNALLAAQPATTHDWLLVMDDDVVLPPGFLDRFLFL